MSDCSTKWIGASFYFYCIGIVLSGAINGALIGFLRTKKRFANYKYLMLAFAVAGLVFSGCNVVVNPNIHMGRNSVIIFSPQKYSKLPKRFESIGLSAFVACFGMMISSVFIQVLYRYTFVTNPSRLAHLFSKKSFILWTLLIVFYSSLFGCSTYYLLGASASKDQTTNEEFMANDCMEPDEYSYIGAEYYQKNIGTIRFHLPSLIGLLVLSLLMIIPIIPIVFIICRMFQIFKEPGVPIYASRKVQRELAKSLLIQTFLYTPFILMFVTFMFGLQISFLVYLFTIFVSIYPCINSLVTMKYVAVLREELSKCFCFNKCHRQRVDIIGSYIDRSVAYVMQEMAIRDGAPLP
ncbi:hypothetical protein GCK72_022977 [Caenorhabditis remanei]|uniref:G-protein coupled receptors family 1 profile domain-containing protein n=1 Tax=Caenorhabditis remanei TaxID=31234 RepID=A0A6A5FVR8_CAERE|nr:hypothetical protein GCK72_022977 [Caenorhabditis remanei]KAF1746521.1 hypothetical protein GCK72_022977 [Caenorhabditis remanei]